MVLYSNFSIFLLLPLNIYIFRQSHKVTQTVGLLDNGNGLVGGTMHGAFMLAHRPRVVLPMMNLLPCI